MFNFLLLSLGVTNYNVTGHSFPAVHSKTILWLKKYFLEMLSNLKQLNNTHLSMLEHNDPGLCIYHIPQFN